MSDDARLVAAARAALAAWQLPGDVALEPLPGGHINDSIRVTLAGPRGARYLLQRLNARVFTRPVQVMENVAAATARLDAAARAGEIHWRVPLLRPTVGGALWHEDRAGACWRLFPWLDGVVSREAPRSPGEAREVARAYGDFLRVLNTDVAATGRTPARAGRPLRETLHVTIPGFHDTAARLEALDRVAGGTAESVAGRARACAAELGAIRRRAPLAAVLPPLMASGDVPVRAVHNDAKMSNVLLDAETGRVAAVVDLDTVMPGSALHDFGDMVRSMACDAAEDEADLERVAVDTDLFGALAAGYLDAAGALITPAERRLLVHGGLVIVLEQAARFLADHIAGDVYYRTDYPGQNLQRTRTQLALLSSLEHHQDELQRTIAPEPDQPSPGQPDRPG